MIIHIWGEATNLKKHDSDKHLISNIANNVASRLNKNHGFVSHDSSKIVGQILKNKDHEFSVVLVVPSLAAIMP